MQKRVTYWAIRILLQILHYAFLTKRMQTFRDGGRVDQIAFAKHTRYELVHVGEQDFFLVFHP